MSLLPSEREWARYSQSSRLYRALREPEIALGWLFAAVHLAPHVLEVNLCADAVGHPSAVGHPLQRPAGIV